MSKGNSTQHRAGAECFLAPQIPAQRQYEAVRAYLVEGLSAKEAARRFGYSTATLYSLCREFRAGRLAWFEPSKPGPKRAPKRDAVHRRVVELRKQNLSVYDIQRVLRNENMSVSHVLIHQILREEGFAKLPRRCDGERPSLVRPDQAEVADVRAIDWRAFANFETEGTALFVLLPALLDWGVGRWVRRAFLPGSRR